MIGDVTAAIGAEAIGAHRRRVDKDVRGIGIRTKRVHVGMFEQQQPVVGAVFEQRVLQIRGFAVGNGPEPADAQR